MRKQIASLVLCLGLFMGIAAQASAPDSIELSQYVSLAAHTVSDAEQVAEVKREVILASSISSATAAAAPADFHVNGTPVYDVYWKSYDQTIYVSVRDMAQAVRPGIFVQWNGTMAEVWAEDLYITAQPGQTYIMANERYLFVPNGVRVEDGNVLVPVRTLAKAFDCTVEWSAQKGVSITTRSGALTHASAYYNSDDLYWLSHIIYAESGNQPLNGMIAVGNVILNRVNSPRFPDTVYRVVHQRGQFSPVANGSINLTPNTQSIIAAKLCLDGAQVLDGILYFNRAGMSSWASRNRPFVATIKDHSFFA